MKHAGRQVGDDEAGCWLEKQFAGGKYDGGGSFCQLIIMILAFSPKVLDHIFNVEQHNSLDQVDGSPLRGADCHIRQYGQVG
jgi:hypothetical protein